MPIDIFNRIRTAVALPDYMKDCGVEAINVGDEYSGKCFKHADDGLSLRIFNDGAYWKFKCSHVECGVSGDVVDFHALKFQCTTADAINALNSKFKLDASPVPDDIYTARRQVNAVLKANLTGDTAAMERVQRMGLSARAISDHGVGMTGPDMFGQFRAMWEPRFKSANDLLMFLSEVGIATAEKGRVVPNPCFAEGKFTIPYFYDNKISHWYAVYADGGKGVEYRLDNSHALLYLQSFLHVADEIYLTENPLSAIALNAAGKAATAVGQKNKEKIELLQSTYTPGETETQKKVFLAFQQGKHGDGARRAAHWARVLCQHHEVFLCIPPDDESIESIVAKGGAAALPTVKYMAEQSAVVVDQGKYWIKQKEKAAHTVISNFTLKRKYVFRSKDGNCHYEIRAIRSDGIESRACTLPAEDLANIMSFRSWLLNRGLDLVYDGDSSTLNELVRYLSVHEIPRGIDVWDAYGMVKPGVWLADNGALIDGTIIRSDDDGIIEVNKGDLEAIKTTLGEDLGLVIPLEWWTPMEIIERLLKYYGRIITWKILGFATACFYHNAIRATYKQFPVAACFGTTGHGKTSCAMQIASLLGCGNVGNPTGKSTAKGIGRLLSLMRSLPVICNEFDAERLDSLIRTIYDGDRDVSAQKTMGDEINLRSVNTTMILTQERVPQDPSIINRMILFDFFKFVVRKDDDKLIRMFLDHEYESVMKGKNFGWLYSLSRSGGESTIIDDIRYSQDKLVIAAKSQGKDLEARQLKNNAVIFGSLRNAFRVLGLKQAFDEIGILPPDEKELMEAFVDNIDVTKALTHEEDPLKIFFEVFERAALDGRINSHYQCVEVREPGDDCPGSYGYWAVRFRLNNIFELVMAEERKGSNRLSGVTAKDIASMLKYRMGIEQQANRFNGATHHSVHVSIWTLNHKFGVNFRNLLKGFVDDDRTETVPTPAEQSGGTTEEGGGMPF